MTPWTAEHPAWTHRFLPVTLPALRSMNARTPKIALLATAAVLLAFGIGALAQRFGGWPWPVPTAEKLEGVISDPARMGYGRFGNPPELGRGYIVWDPTAGHAHVPNARFTWRWTEYERGKVALHTNNIGLRRDVDTELQAPEGVARVLVVGDSHVDGFVDNDQNFCQLLEDRLGERAGGAPVEVLNGGVITSGPHNYVGHVERFYQLGLDLVVVVLYDGNDFLNAVTTAAIRGVIEIPPRSPEYLRQIEDLLALQPVQQGPNQARFFKEFPELREKALEEVRRQMRWLRHLSEKGGFDLLLVMLPSKFEIEWPQWSEAAVAEAAAVYLDVLGLVRADLDVNRELAESLVTALREDEFAVVDLREALETAVATRGKLYWDGDYHLSQAGHEVVAEVLLGPVRRALGR